MRHFRTKASRAKVIIATDTDKTIIHGGKGGDGLL
jgi:hypothetical protein